MDKIVSDLKRGLGEGATKVDLTKGLGNSLSKSISKFKDEYDKFTRLTKDGQLKFGDSKEAIQSGEQMVKIFKELQRVVGNFEELTLFDAKKMFPQAFDARVNELQNKMKNFQETLSRLEIKGIEVSEADRELKRLQTQKELLENSFKEELTLQIDTSELDKAAKEAKEKLQDLREELKQAIKTQEDTARDTLSKGNTRIAEIKAAREARGVTTKPTLKGVEKEQEAATRAAIALYKAEQQELDELEKKVSQAAKQITKLTKAYASADTSQLKDLATAVGAGTEKYDEITAAIDAEADATKRATDAQKSFNESQENIDKIKKNINETSEAINRQSTTLQKLQGQYNALKQKLDTEGMEKAFSELGIDFAPEMLKNSESVEKLQKELDQLSQADLDKLIQSLKKMGLTSKEAEDFVEGLKGELATIDDTRKDINRAAQDMENLKQQVLDFFSITNAVQLFKSTIQSALETVKELDATMTEAAVVTDFSVNDMWEQLPRYSAEAQKLGVSINGMYQATTLYYQQGLKTNEAMELGVETMKMAKIAGMESADATKAMTSALRGFNMELNETSATRVNDVYSQLAAVTAADTNQIANAMEKTASIASAANMEFETTAAFLAQIIETTQEAPETAGTAMKTIVARFSEVKSLASQGLVSGEDSEGEVIDVNKIQTALRSVGISMDEFFAGTEGLDSVLLKLAEKWETLDFETQRYIATMAAGSRQQSRFIAMMSDYGRTVELVDAANNSAGASQKQYEKTLDSLETALTKLKNAWDQFAMGLANNEILKFGVNLLTGLLETINKVIDTISGGNGLIKSVVSLGLAIGGLALGGKVLDAVFRSLGSSLAVGAGLKDLDAEKTKKQTAETAKLITVEKIQEKLTTSRIAKLLTEIGTQGISIVFTKIKNRLTWESVRATAAHTVELLKNNTAMLKGIGIVASYVAGIALAVVGVMNLVKAWNETGDGAKEIEETNSQIQEMQEQLREANDELDNLTSAQANLEEMREGFEGLAKGTAEWKKQLVKVNDEVLSLIQQYPALGAYVMHGESGELTIRDEGWEAVQGDLQQRIYSASNTQASLQLKKNSLEQQQQLANVSKILESQKHWEDFLKNGETKDAAGLAVSGLGVIGGAKLGAAIGTSLGPIGVALGGLAGGLVGFTIGHLAPDVIDDLNGTIVDAEREATGGLTQEEFMAFAAKAQESGVNFVSGSTESDFKAIFEQMGFQAEDWSTVWDSISAMGTKFDELAVQATRLETAQEAYVTSILMNIAQSDASIGSHKYSEQIIEMSKQTESDLVSEVRNEASKISEDKEYIDDGEATDKLIEEYAAAMEMTKDQVTEKITAGGLSAETMAQAVAQSRVDDQVAQNMKETAKALDSLAIKAKSSGKSIESLTRVLSIQGKDMLVEDMKLFESLTQSMTESQLSNQETQKKIVDDYLKATTGQSLEASGLDWQSIWGNLSLGTANFKEAFDKASGWGGTLDGRVSASAASNLIKKIEEQTNAGATGAAELMKQIQEIITNGNLDAEQAQAFYDALGAIDWNNIKEVGDLSEKLEGLGLDMGFLGNAVRLLEENIVHFSDAVYNLTPEEKGKKVEGTKSLLEKIQKDGMGQSFSEDDLDYLPDSIKDKMVLVGEKYYYSGNLTTNEVISEIKEKAGRDLSTESRAEAFENKNAAQAEEGLYGTKKVGTNYIKGRRDHFGKVRSAAEVGAELVFDEAKVENSELVKFVRNQGSKSIEFDVATSKQWENWTSYADRGIDAGNARGQLENGPSYDRKIYQLWTQNQTSALPGLFGTESLDEVSQWYESLSESGKMYFGAWAGTLAKGNTADVFGGEAEVARNKRENQYGYFDVTLGKAANSLIESTDWEIMGQLASGELSIQDTGDTYVTEEIGENQLSAEAINTMYKKYYSEGTADTVQEKAEALIKFYTENESKSNGMTKEDYYQEMALASGQKLLDTFERTNFDTQATAVANFMDAQITNMTGGIEVVKTWEEQLQNAGSALFNNDKIIKALALTYDDFNKNVDNLNSVLSQQIDYFSLGEEAGQFYYQALVDIANAAEGSFGKHIDTTFVEKHRQLFIDLEKGGEAAAAAWDLLAQKSFELWLETSGQSVEVYQGIADYINSYPLQVGVAIEIEKTDEMLANWEATVAAMAAQGINLIKNTQGQILATKSNYIGTGSNADKKTSSDKWKNPYDVFYNTLAKINEAMREREKLEREYQRLMDRGDVTGQKLVEKLKLQTAELQEEAKLQRDIVKGRQQQMENYVANQGLKKYGWIENGEVRINWAEINKISGSERGQEVQDYISQLEEWSESLKEAEDRLEEIEEEVYEINETGKNEYLDLEQAVADALRESYQKQIDELSNINESINDANSRLIEAMQSSIEKDRQARENERTEEEIADKQARLAYLQQDTSGANALEAMQLEKEIAEEQENYTDSLIDQKISELQEQNDKAAEQRERQIEVARAQLKQWFDNDHHWNEVINLIKTGTKDGQLLNESSLATLLKENENFKSLSTIAKEDWWKDWTSRAAAAWAWMESGGSYNVNTEAGSNSNSDFGNIKKSTSKTGNTSSKTANVTSKESIEELQEILKEYGYTGEIDGKYGAKTRAAVERYQKANNLAIDAYDGASVLEHYKKVNKKGFLESLENVANEIAGSFGDAIKSMFGIKFVTGGLADYTGPAWLDGTKSKPELVLNARDTQNFIQLKDILASLMGRPEKSNENTGATSFDIDINVETINNESDLEMIAKYIENKITTSANYRNNTLIRSSR